MVEQCCATSQSIACINWLQLAAARCALSIVLRLMGDEISTSKWATGTRTWTLCWQAAPSRDFLAHDSMVRKILNRLIDAHSQSGRQLLYFVLLPAEIHVIARVECRENIASIVRSCSHILSRWVRAVNPRQGPAFAAKCRATPIESMPALRREVLMLAWRPVRLGFSKTPMHYPYSALRGGEHGELSHRFNVGPLLSIYGESPDAARACLEASLRVRPTDEAWRFWELKRGLEQPTAKQSFVSATTMPRLVDAGAAALIAAGGGYGVEAALSLLDAWVCAKIDPAGRLNAPEGYRGLRVRARALVACLAVDHGLCSAVFVARHHGCTKGTISVQMARCRLRQQDRKLLEAPLERILQDVMVLRGAGLMRSLRGAR